MGGKNLQELVKKQAKIISEQAEAIKKLEALAAELRETIARLQKDSRNSSKPPSSDLEEILGTAFGGIITSDFFGAYRKFSRVSGTGIQLCWAHLIREVLFLETLQENAAVRYGKRIINQIRLMFQTIHRKGEIGEEAWKELMWRHRELIIKRATGTVPEQKEARLTAKRLRQHEDECFRFIESGIEPTNNAAELAIRQTVLDRAVTQGSRGIRGNEWHERFWTVLTTCGIQKISVMKYLKECLSAYFGLDIPPNSINLAV
jgi:hypothetical protein